MRSPSRFAASGWGFFILISASLVAYLPKLAYSTAHEGVNGVVRTFITAFKALADETRLRAYHLILAADRPVCVCELADALGLPQYRISKHLAILRQAGLVVDSRVGTWVHYSPVHGESAFNESLVQLVRETIESSQLERDVRKLHVRFSLRRGDECIIGTDDVRVVQAFERAGLIARKHGEDESHEPIE